LGGGKKVRLEVEPHHYYKNYDTKERFCSYWHQIEEIVSHNPTSILEIGIGNGFVSRYLRQRGFNVVTLDIDKRLNPDVAGSALNIPFSDETFEVVTCYELLEHLPYGNFEKAISEVFRVSNSYVLLSLPDANRVYRIYIQIPKLGEFKKLVEIPRLRKPIHHFDGQHCWEIGKAGYSLNTIINAINKVGFNIEKTYRVFEMPYHRFFILKKIKRCL
jgi:ubiquinone/menaquinone biosynthesis C-methylase UbiE